MIKIDWHNWVAIITQIALQVGAFITYQTFKPQSKTVFATIEEAEKAERTVMIFKNQTVEEVVIFFSRPFTKTSEDKEGFILKFDKVDTEYKFIGISYKYASYLFSNFKIIDIYENKDSASTFVLIEKVVK